MLKFTNGDLLRSKTTYIAQGVAEGNQEGLGTGLALKISKLWPEVQTAFKRHARSGRFKGGELWVCDPTENHPGVIYLATQPDMYHATIPFLRKAVRKLAKWAREKQIDSVALPKIGAGLGKLSWETDVRPIFVAHLSEPTTHFVVFETYEPDFGVGKITDG